MRGTVDARGAVVPALEIPAFGLLLNRFDHAVEDAAGESTEPSINDRIASGIGGNFLGEPLFRIASGRVHTRRPCRHRRQSCTSNINVNADPSAPPARQSGWNAAPGGSLTVQR